MRTIDIPGGSASLRDQNEIKVRHKRLIESAAVAAARTLEKVNASKADLGDLADVDIDVAALGLTAEEATRMFELQDAIIVASLAAWTLPDELPTVDTVGDLDPEVYDALAEGTRKEGAALASKVSFDPGNPSDPGFEESPTEPSRDSEGNLKDDHTAELIPLPQSVGESTDSDQSSVG